jgi:hypothetical protein
MLVVEQQNNTVVTEIGGRESHLTAGPDGLHKKIEIGVNNYAP